MWTLTNHVALVTGGSKGIGRAAVEALLERGATVVFTARGRAGVEAFARACAERFSDKGTGGAPRVTGIVADVTDASDRERLRAHLAEHHGRLDILVNNAGTNIRRSAEDYDGDAYATVLDVNLHAPFHLSVAMLDLLKTSDNASIINVASAAGTVDVGSGAPYAMTKGGLAADDPEPRGGVGQVRYPRQRRLAVVYGDSASPTPVLSDAERKAGILRRTPLGRVAQAQRDG